MAKPRLGEYAAKRRFEATPEPAPELSEREGPLLFVVQQHSARRLHYDFRLECDGVLKSWAVPKGPSLDPLEKRLAVPTEDHPFDYASFEGVIPPGQYGAGEVIVWDCGVYSPDEGGETWFHDRRRAEEAVRRGLEQGKLGFLLRGEKLKGSFALVRTAQEKGWLLIKHKDRFAAKTDVTARRSSVLCGHSVEEMKTLSARRLAADSLVPTGKREAMPENLAPMQAEVAEAPWGRAGWSWEPKLDGYRALAFIEGGGVKLRSRRGQDLTSAFPALAVELAAQAVSSMILDGEIVAFERGKPSFHALQNRVQLKSERDLRQADADSPAVFYCFDLLHFAGLDLRGHAYEDRRRYLSQCLLPGPLVQLVHASEDGTALQEAALASGFEGVVAKRNSGVYEAGKRSASWIKVKPAKSAEFVVGGYTKGKGARASLGALLVGYWQGGRLHYASHVGSGFDERSLREVKARLQALKTAKCPFVETPPEARSATWVSPQAVAEVRYQSWTKDGSLRAPVFLRLRDDLDANSIVAPGESSLPAASNAGGEIEEVIRQLENAKSSFTLAVAGERIRLTHLERIYWPPFAPLKQPALTKRDFLLYLARVSPYMLPHLADRPLTLIRMPEGIGGERFYQKHWPHERPAFVEAIRVYSGHKEESHEVLLCNNLATLLWLAQAGTLEFHVWHSRAKPGPDCESEATDYASSEEALDASVLSYPDYVVFDIDPYIYSGSEAPGAEPELNVVAFEKGKEVAFRLRELLREMSLEAIVKTSGKTGLHVFVPIRRTIDFAAAREVSELVGRHLMRRHPKDITLEWSVPKRTGKIFMDYNMNVRGKTLNVAYSPRGEPGAPVSMPLSWEELESAHPLDFRIPNAPERLAATGDRWAGVLERKQSLEKALKK